MTKSLPLVTTERVADLAAVVVTEANGDENPAKISLVMASESPTATMRPETSTLNGSTTDSKTMDANHASHDGVQNGTSPKICLS